MLQYFLRAKGPVCGRLTESQLDRGLSGGGSVRSWAGLRWVRARVELVNVRKIYGPDRLEDRIRRMEPEHGRFLAPQCLSEGPVLMGRMGGDRYDHAPSMVVAAGLVQVAGTKVQFRDKKALSYCEQGAYV